MTHFNTVLPMVKKHSLITAVETITPARARELLATNRANRRLRRAVVVKYAVDMVAHRWQVGSGAISVDINGNLSDGQHRLHACILADTSFTTVMVYGVSPEAIETTDTGLKRGLNDLLAWRGEKSSSALAAAINLGWRLQRGVITSDKSTPTHQQALEWLDCNPSMREAVFTANRLRKPLSAPLSALSVFTWVAHRIDSEEAAAFCEHLLDGAELSLGDPILALRGWMVNQNDHSHGKKANTEYYLAVTIKAWNAWLLGTRVKMLVWKRGGGVREAFPVFVDAEGQPFDLINER